MEPNEDQAKSSMSSEFINPFDHKDKGNFPIKGENGELYMPFFIFKFQYLLGPLILKMGRLCGCHMYGPVYIDTEGEKK